MSKVLVVVAHPDDESFWMGGTIAKMVKEGHEVQVVALADGVGSRRYSEPAADRRRRHYLAALEILGADELLQFENPIFPDQQSDAVPQLEINLAAQTAVEFAKPDVVYTHWAGDLNIDHRRTAEAVLVATRPDTYRCQVFAMRPEYPKRSLWQPASHQIISDVDIRATIDTKLKACLCYADEMRWYPHPRSERAILEQTTEQFYAYD